MSEYQLVITDGGRSTSRRPKQTHDCSVRAMAIALEMPYDDAYDFAAKLGRVCGKGVHPNKIFDAVRYAEKKMVWMTLPSHAGFSRMTVTEFCRQRREGSYILKVAHHVFAVIDGVAQDTWRGRGNRCVYGYWKVIPRWDSPYDIGDIGISTKLGLLAE